MVIYDEQQELTREIDRLFQRYVSLKDIVNDSEAERLALENESIQVIEQLCHVHERVFKMQEEALKGVG
jgi:hypothetical protein